MDKDFWPEGKKFAFTIIDDTDNSTLDNAPLIYDYLHQNNVLTTKSVWVREGSEDSYYESVNGDTLANEEYLRWVKELKENGFEICLHSTSWSSSTRTQILEGIRFFESHFGRSKTLIQHNDIKDCESIYWGSKRLVRPLSWIFQALSYINPSGVKSKSYQGENEESIYFWGDICKKKIDYIRNLTFPEINLFAITQDILHKRKKTKYANSWFISSEAPDLSSFVEMLSKANLDKLETENGLCIIYTHFGSGFVSNGSLSESFKEVIDDLSQRAGWFVPADQILEYVSAKQGGINTLTYAQEFKLSVKWLLWKILHGTS